MVHKSTAVAARQNLGGLLEKVQYGRASVLITKYGKPVAGLVEVALFERICRLRDDFKRLTDTIGQSFVGVAPARAEAEIGEAVAWARRRAAASRGARRRR